MAVSIGGIIINVVMVVIIIIIVIVGFVFNNELTTCQNTASQLCYQIQCPCDNQQSGPCFGYASRPGSQSGSFYCSNAPGTLVDAGGIPL